MQDRETTPEERIPALQDNATATGKSGRMSRLTKTMSRLRSRTHRRTTSTASALHAENSFEDDVEKTTTSISEPVPYSESFRSESPQRLPDRNDADGPQKFLKSVNAMLAVESTLLQLQKSIAGAQAFFQALEEAENSSISGHIQPTLSARSPSMSLKDDHINSWYSSSDGQRWQRYLDELDAALIERRLSDAASHLKKLERMLSKLVLSRAAQETDISVIMKERQRLQWQVSDALVERKHTLVGMLQNDIKLRSIGDAEKAALLQLLAAITSPSEALETALQYIGSDFEARLKSTSTTKAPMPAAHAATAAGGSRNAADPVYFALMLATEFGKAACRARFVASAVAAHQGSLLEVNAAIISWVLQASNSVCEELKLKMLLPFTVPAGFQQTARCIYSFFTIIDQLLPEYATVLRPVMVRSLWPLMEKTYSRRVRQVCEGIQVTATREMTAALNRTETLPPAAGTPWETLVSVIPSADKLLQEVESMCISFAGFASPLAAATLRQGIAAIFKAFIAGASQPLTDNMNRNDPTWRAAAEISMEVSERLAERAIPDSLLQFDKRQGYCFDFELASVELDKLGTRLGLAAV